MSRFAERPIEPVLQAAARWRDRCLIGDASLFGEGELWLLRNFALIDRHFVQQPDAGDEGFYEKLEKQMVGTPSETSHLMAELLWVLFLFPSNTGPAKKRDGVVRTWEFAGSPFPKQRDLLSDAVLNGVGSAGTAYGTQRWREVGYAVALFSAFKRLPNERRKVVAGSYDAFMEFSESVPLEGERQFRHMLRFLLFPDVVERMSSNGDRRRILEAFDGVPQRATRGWSDRQLDSAMLDLRRRLEKDLGRSELDFYLPPLEERWRGRAEHASDKNDVATSNGVAEEHGRVSRVAPPTNLILHGPPGTGKTHAVVDEALKLLDLAFYARNQDNRPAMKRRYDDLVALGQIDFVTFHQSFSYEDFVEGLRADRDSETGALRFSLEEGIFKRLCTTARATTTRKGPSVSIEGRRVWKMSLGDARSEPHIYEECIRSNKVLLGWGNGADFTGCRDRGDIVRVLGRSGETREPNDYPVTAVHTLLNRMQDGDIVVATDGNTRFRAIGQVTGGYHHVQRNGEDTFAQSRPVRWLRVYEPSLPHDQLMHNPFTQKTIYELHDGSVDRKKLQSLLNDADSTNGDARPYALIIDEINRGNISRIFGELITLIEPSKRSGQAESLEIVLPYSKQRFSVPSNLHLIGTMNTADRSLTGLDVALRRRFEFIEMPPRPESLRRIVVGSIRVEATLAAMNRRIEALLDREHRIGHAYFLPLSDAPTLEHLGRIFRARVLPLLQEYFFEDWHRIRLVLNDQRKPAHAQFIIPNAFDSVREFGAEDSGAANSKLWKLNEDALANEDSYRLISEVT